MQVARWWSQGIAVSQRLLLEPSRGSVCAVGHVRASYLGPEELRGRVLVCIIRRDMNEPVHVVLCDSLCYSLCSLDMDIIETEVLGGLLPANQVEDDVGMPYAFFDGLCVPQIIFHERHSSQITHDLQVSLRHLFSKRNDDLTSSPG